MNIDRISKRLNLSKTTVSRVLNGKPEVSEKTRQRVLDAMKELNYRPNPYARSLNGKKSKYVALIVEDITNPFYKDLFKGVQKICAERGFGLITSSSLDQSQNRILAVDYFLDGVVDGIILMESDVGDEGYLRRLEMPMVPIVLVEDNVSNDKIPSVRTDNVRIGHLATRRLIELGHRRIAHISGRTTYKVALDRIQGYRTALAEAGIEIRDEDVVSGNFELEGGYLAMKTLWGVPRRPTAVFAGNDLMAYGAIRALEEAGAQVPRDCSIVGVDGLQPLFERSPYLTTVKQPIFEFGTKSAEILFDLISTGSTSQSTVLLESVLIEGKTTLAASE